MVDTTKPTGSMAKPLHSMVEAGARDELIRELEKTIMQFRLEDFDRSEVNQCAQAVYLKCRAFLVRSSSCRGLVWLVDPSSLTLESEVAFTPAHEPLFRASATNIDLA